MPTASHDFVFSASAARVADARVKVAHPHPARHIPEGEHASARGREKPRSAIPRATPNLKLPFLRRRERRADAERRQGQQTPPEPDDLCDEPDEDAFAGSLVLALHGECGFSTR